MAFTNTCDVKFAILAVGFGSFFLLYVSETVSDMLPNHLPWSTTCINTTYWNYTHRRAMSYWEAQTTIWSWTQWRCEGAAASALFYAVAVVVAPGSVKRNAQRVIKVSASLTSLSVLCALWSIMDLGHCRAFMRYHNALIGLGTSLAMCSCVSLAHSVAAKTTLDRDGIYEFFALCMLLGELVGFFIAWTLPVNWATPSARLLLLIWTLGFNNLFYEVSDHFGDAGLYFLIASALSIACCVLSFLSRCVAPSAKSGPGRRTGGAEKYRLTMLLAVGFLVNVTLLLIDLDDDRLVEFASVAVTDYFMSNGLYRECLLELVPLIFDAEVLPAGWALTVYLWQFIKDQLRVVLYPRARVFALEPIVSDDASLFSLNV